MKKLVCLFVGLIILGISATSVSAEEYEVHKGDTLWNIAIDHHTNVEELMNINGLKSSLIYPKQVLKLNENEIEYYVIQKGDTLSDISKSKGDGVTVAKLKAWNDLPSDLIVTGQQLIVNGAEIAQPQQGATKQMEQTANTGADASNLEPAVKAEAGGEVSQSEKNEEPKKEQAKVVGRTLTVEATAYTAYCAGCSGVTATGVNLKENPNAKVIAVDPNVIPLGTKVYVEGYGFAVAADTGGAIVGNKIDVHLATKDQAFSWGRRTVDITIVD